MSVTSGFFPINRGIQDLLYDSEQVSRYFQGLYLNGILASIGDFFTCEVIDVNHVKVKSGFGYLDGLYVYNKNDYICEVPDSLYPTPPISGITVSTPPQLDYPVGNPLDLGDIVVSGLPANIEIVGIEVENPPQLNYPVGNSLDLGDIAVRAILDETPLVITGDCYIVVRLKGDTRSFIITAIKVDDYNLNTDLLIAKVTRDANGITLKNVVGYSDDDITGAPMLTGLNQGVYLTDLMNVLDEVYSNFISNWQYAKEAYYTSWQANNIYCLDTVDQYNRLMAELDGKSNKPLKRSIEVRKNDTTKTISYSNMPQNIYVDAYSMPSNLAITNILVDGSDIIINFLPAYNDCILYVEVY